LLFPNSHIILFLEFWCLHYLYVSKPT
jgi:hypothetical protein